MASTRKHTKFIGLSRILAFSAIVEIATGLALEAAPVSVVSLLLGVDDSSEGIKADSRLFGIALIALGVACWPGRAAGGPPAYAGMLLYNALIALSLAFLATTGPLHGLLIWPAVTLHAIVALSLLWSWRSNQD